MVKIHSYIEDLSVKRPVVTIGMFDGVHKGHHALLSQLVELAKEAGGESVVITFWPHPRVVLGKDEKQLRFLTTLEEKTRLISEAGVDHIIILPFSKDFSALTAEAFIRDFLVRKMQVFHLLVGYNHRFGHGGITFEGLQNIAHKYSFNLSRFGPLKIEGMKPSSTTIRQFISDGDVYEASRLLGRYYGLKGRIVGGKRLGRKIGYPTANIVPDDPGKLIPHDGVYACMVHLLGRTYGGMINVGKRPTVDGDFSAKTLEVHIFDFSREVYSEQIVVEFIERTRPEIKFPDVEALRSRLQEDEVQARNILHRNGLL